MVTHKGFCCCWVAQLCLTFCNPMHCSTPGFPVLHYLLESAQTRVHWVNNAIQPSHPLLSLSPPALNLFQHQGLFQWVGFSHQVAKVLEPPDKKGCSQRVLGKETTYRALCFPIQVWRAACRIDLRLNPAVRRNEISRGLCLVLSA